MGASRWAARVGAVATLILLSAAICAAGPLAVTVVDAGTGAALAKAVVVVVSGETVLGAGRTNADGLWSGTVADGRATVIATKDLHVTQTRAINTAQTSALRFELAQHKQEDFKRLGRIVGFVRSTGGQALPNATLVLFRGETPVGATQPENATGVYELEWYPPGSYSVLATAVGHRNAKHPGQTITGGESLWLDIALQPR